MCRSVLAAELGAATRSGRRWPTRACSAWSGSTAASTDVGVFCVEAGRALCPRVVHSTVYAALAIDWLGVRSRAWLPRLTSGEARGTTALFNPRDASDVTPRCGATRR